MKNEIDHEAMFWRILEKNRLVDLSQFHKPDFYEETPLYSRVADIEFLADYSADEASHLLLKFALKYLKSVVSYDEHETPFFAAVTVSEISPGDPIVPSIFVWSRPIEELFERLTLTAPKSVFGKKIRRLVSHLDLPDRLEVFEDNATVPDSPREFIAPALPPNRGFVPIYMFCQPSKAARSMQTTNRK